MYDGNVQQFNADLQQVHPPAQSEGEYKVKT